MLHHPCILGGPQQREQNRKSKPTPGVTMMQHATKRGFKDCPKCAPLAHPLKGHRWGTGPKRCPARARRANVPPMHEAPNRTFPLQLLEAVEKFFGALAPWAFWGK